MAVRRDAACTCGIFFIQSPAWGLDLAPCRGSGCAPRNRTFIRWLPAKMNELIKETKKSGITILITDGFGENQVEQDVLYRQGRSGDGQIVTNVKGGDSYHNYGLAIDFALGKVQRGKVIWDLEYDGNHNGQSDWMKGSVAIAKSLGFTWGGDWSSFKDYPHLQMDFGYSIKELKKAKKSDRQI